MEIIGKEFTKSEDKEYFTIQLKKRETQIAILLAFDTEEKNQMLYSGNLKKWILITPEREYYKPYIEFINSRMEMTIAR